MRGILMRFFSGILIVFFLVSPAPGAAAGEMAMKEGSHGAAVHALKVRLFDLGYLDAVHDANDRYGPATAAQVAHFQERSGLPATGEADARTLEALYSPGAVKAPLPEGRPLYDVDPDAVPDVRPDGMPDLDAGGFLPQGSEPFVYKNRAAGYWAYVSDRLNISVTRFYQSAGQIEWFEAYVSFRDGGKPVSVESDRDGKALEQPLHLAREAGAVLALSDDFWRYRKANELHT
ncbi:MAG TPA: peptidoglycan-binding domain-containing protein, partial [Candidatus Limnocylindria bacterium]|nr:peptidoglycan-binding domain-containing protein [Candidatus Limnocylindria bacterium]